MGPRRDATVVRRRTNVLFVAPTFSPGVVAVFDTAGRLRRTIGRAGGGPGEYRRISRLFLIDGDTLVLVDEEAGTLTFLDAENQPVGWTRVSVRVDDLEPAGGDRLILAVRSSQAGLGPLQIVSRDGSIIRVFGRASDEPFEPMSYRRIATDDQGRLWSAHTNEYRIDQYAPEGDLNPIDRPGHWMVSADDGGRHPSRRREWGTRPDDSRQRPRGRRAWPAVGADRSERPGLAATPVVRSRQRTVSRGCRRQGRS
ncbi:MAG: 6-bladed beta-propeller, partial [Longimicrobiales bacterium]